jgi:hypothetical protein
MAAPAKGDPASARDAATDVMQHTTASDQAIQAVLGSGEQHLHFGDRVRPAEPAVSLAPPFGLRTDDLPVRGRDELLTELTSSSSRSGGFRQRMRPGCWPEYDRSVAASE